MKEEAKLLMYNGGYLLINDFQKKDDYFSASATIKSNWYEANIKFTSSKERFVEFVSLLNKMLMEEYTDVNFINEDGNFDIDLSLDKATGICSIKGVLIENMMDEALLKFSLESDFQSLLNFYQELKLVI